MRTLCVNINRLKKMPLLCYFHAGNKVWISLLRYQYTSFDNQTNQFFISYLNVLPLPYFPTISASSKNKTFKIEGE